MVHMCSASSRELTAGIKAQGVDSRWCLGKADLVQLYDRLQQVFAICGDIAWCPESSMLPHLLDHRVSPFELHISVTLSASLNGQIFTFGSQFPYILRAVNSIKSGLDAMVMIDLH